MCLHPTEPAGVPAETSRVAWAAFPKGNAYLRIRDQVGVLYSDEAFAPLYSSRGQPAYAAWRLALVCLLQYVENLSDRQAAEAVRSRIDWKYLLGLQLTDPGFDYSVLCEFRTRLLKQSPERLLLERMLACLIEQGLCGKAARQRTDSTHVLAAIRQLNRIEMVAETLRHTLDILAQAAPGWLGSIAPLEWQSRYAARIDSWRLPRSQAQRREWAEHVGEDGKALLEALFSNEAPPWLRQLPAIELLRQVWLQQYQQKQGRLALRADKDLPPASLLIRSPHDPQARNGGKRGQYWTGYKVHLTESCDAGAPHLITHVYTQGATCSDTGALLPIQDALAQRDLLPKQHLVDAGYTSAHNLLQSQKRQVDLLGPLSCGTGGAPGRDARFFASHFQVDFSQERVTCPAGHTSVRWERERGRDGKEALKVYFAPKVCRACALRPQCTRSKKQVRTLRLYPKELYEPLQYARERQKSEAFAQAYKARAGVEGTLSEGVRCHGLRTCRYVGQKKAHLQQVLVAAAINLVRIGAWLDPKPVPKRPKSPFARLHLQTTT
ncbi:MAG: IS1182 family transposase [Actinomycetota bacterium]|nr:IS1182 family transposase [Actinomycetota bacterium]